MTELYGVNKKHAFYISNILIEHNHYADKIGSVDFQT